MEQTPQAPADRRPGIDKLIAEIQRRNPSWSMARASAEAKQQWSDRHLQAQRQEGSAT